MSKKYKITPLGYLLLLIIILSTLFLTARLFQNRSPITSLIYKLNHTEMAYASGHIELKSEGDVINLANKDIFLNFETSKEYIHLGGLLKNNQIMLPEFDSFFNHEKLLFKTSLQKEYIEMGYDELYLLSDSSYDYQINELIKAIRDNDSIYSLFQKYPFVFSKVLNPYALQNNEEIIISITFDDLINIIDELIVELQNEDYFQQFLLSYIMDYYHIYGDFEKNHSAQEQSLWHEDFPETLQKKITSFKRVLLKEYDSLSQIELIFNGNKDFETISLKGQFYYNHCDAYENLLIELKKCEVITPYPDIVNSHFKPNLTLLKTFFEFYQ